jgi:hypothetical protein
MTKTSIHQIDHCCHNCSRTLTGNTHIKRCRNTFCKYIGKDQYCCPVDKCRKAYVHRKNLVSRHLAKDHADQLFIEGVRVEATVYYDHVTTLDEQVVKVYQAPVNDQCNNDDKAIDEDEEFDGTNEGIESNNPIDNSVDGTDQKTDSDKASSANSDLTEMLRNCFQEHMKGYVQEALAQSTSVTDHNFFNHKKAVQKVIRDVSAMVDTDESFETISRRDEMLCLLSLLAEYPDVVGRKLTINDVPDMAMALKHNMSRRLSDKEKSGKKTTIGDAPIPLGQLRAQLDNLIQKFQHTTSAEVRALGERLGRIEVELEQLEEGYKELQYQIAPIDVLSQPWDKNENVTTRMEKLKKDFETAVAATYRNDS